MKPLRFGSLLLAWAAAVHGQATAQPTAPAIALVPTQSEIVFTTRQMGVPVEGRFGRFDARIALDPKRPEGGSIGLAIDTASARFGSAELDGEVGKPIWLAAARFPQASFQSAGIKAVGAGRLEISGKLTIKGASRDIVVPVSLQQSGGQTTAIGSFTVKRLDFKVGEAEWADASLLADEVAVRFRLVLNGVGPL